MYFRDKPTRAIGSQRGMKIPLNPPSPIKQFEDKFSKGEVKVPLFGKEGLGGDFRSKVFITAWVITLVVLSGCYSSRFYKPVSEWEKREFIKANRNIYPDDILTSPE